MLRAIGGVIVGYLVMALIVIGTFSAAYLTMGADRAFQPGTYNITPLWLGTSFVLSFIAAFVGGWVCRAIARGRGAAWVLAALVLVVGCVLALPALRGDADPRPRVRLGPVGNFEAMQNARQEPWVMLAMPFVGAVGVLLGARRK